MNVFENPIRIKKTFEFHFPSYSIFSTTSQRMFETLEKRHPLRYFVPRCLPFDRKALSLSLFLCPAQFSSL